MTPRTTSLRSVITGTALSAAIVAMAGSGLALQAQSAKAPAKPAEGKTAPSQKPAGAAGDVKKALTLDDVLKAVATYDGGIESAAMWTLRDYVYARKDSPAGRAECEATLLVFLKSPATHAARLAASRHLRVIAGDTAVPALQAMLADDRTADLALYALQQIPGEAVDAALVAALKTSTGPIKIAVVTALGQRRTATAVPAVAPLLQQPAFAGAAATTLGRIGGDAASAALVAAYAGASAELKPVVASSLLAAAERSLADKNPGAARRVYDMLAADTSLPAPQRKAAGMGRISAGGSGAGALLLEMLRSSDTGMQEAAIASVAGTFAPGTIAQVCPLLAGLPESSQVQLLAVLATYPADRVVPAILNAVKNEAVAVRIAAMKALEPTGGPSVVQILAETAATAKGPEQAAARAALGMLKGRAVDEAVVSLLGQKVSDDVAAELLLTVADRRIFPAKRVVSASLASPSTRVRLQALKSLRTVGTPSDIPAVLDVLLRSRDESEWGDAEKTAATLAQTIAKPEGRSRTMVERLAAETEAAPRVRLINVLALIGDSSALPVLRTALEDTDADVHDAAVRALAAWPTSAALDDIRRLARDSRNETHRLLAIRGLVRVVSLDTYRNPDAAVADLKLAAGFAWRPEEYNLILGALPSFPCGEALGMANGFLREPSVKAEAQAAIDNITKRLAKTSTR